MVKDKSNASHPTPKAPMLEPSSPAPIAGEFAANE